MIDDAERPGTIADLVVKSGQGLIGDIVTAGDRWARDGGIAVGAFIIKAHVDIFCIPTPCGVEEGDLCIVGMFEFYVQIFQPGMCNAQT